MIQGHNETRVDCTLMDDDLHMLSSRTPLARCTGGTQPDRISLMRNLETPIESANGSKPTVRKV
jgi:hypothetical protein